jgi:hypothetical protein
VGDSIFKVMAAKEKFLKVIYGYSPYVVTKNGDRVGGAGFINQDNDTLQISAEITIDATELGDLMFLGKVPYSLGMESDEITGENVGVKATNDIIQDITYVAILKDYGQASDCTIVKPSGYDPAEFDGACTDYYTNPSLPKPTVDAKKMLEYAKLPNDKYLINWPIRGNDTYLNLVELSPAERMQKLEASKETTLRFIYFIQSQLGYKNLGLANDEFPTPDRLPIIPYYREGRRVNGLVRYTITQIADPYNASSPLYRTGIAVGDYPIDHHHKKNPVAPQHLDFYPIPSFAIPFGTLIPKTVKGLVIAEKGISVSNVVNGTTRLQPCVMLTGQAAGMLAALSARHHVQPAQIGVRKLQQKLLEGKVYLLPYIDVPPTNPYFSAIQKTGLCGILRGTGVPYHWENQTWFYPDSLVSVKTFRTDYKEFDSVNWPDFNNDLLTIDQAIGILFQTAKKHPEKVPRKTRNHMANNALFTVMIEAQWNKWGLKDYLPKRPLTRAELAVLLDHTIDPFSLKAVDYQGFFNNN